MSARRLLAAAFATFAVALVGAPSALAKSADITNAGVDLRLAKDGSLLVTEHLTFNYDGHFEGSYRDIVLAHGEQIRDVQISQGGEVYKPGGDVQLGSFDVPGVFGTQDRGDVYRIVWHYRADDEQRTYDISYRVVDGAVAYDDVIDVGWGIWGDQWDFDLDHLSASLTNPNLDPADPAYRVWGHPRDVEGETVRGDGAATLEASDVPSGTAVEFRVTIPRTPGMDVSGMRVVNHAGLSGIIATEKGLDEDYNSFFNRLKRFVEDNWLLLVIGLAALAALLHIPLRFAAREHDVSVPEYVAEPPDDAPPALAYGLAHEGVDSDDTVLATLLDLIDRDYYSTKSSTGDEEKLDLAIQAKAQADRPTSPLTDYEQEVLEFFDQLLDGESVALSDMKDKIPQHSELWRGRWERMTEKIYAADEGQLAWDLNLNPLRNTIIVSAVVLQVIVVIFHLADGGGWFFPIALCVLTFIGLASLNDTTFKRVDHEHADRVARWKSFEHWTEDFPRLKDDPPQTLDLWKRILVYGVAFGTADRMIKSGRIPAPVAEASSDSGLWTAYAFSSGFNSAAFSGASFSSGFASQVAPESSSGGGGGSFSGGGGGGFSGGGGGGSW
jgi:uncharacterized membrane protein